MVNKVLFVLSGLPTHTHRQVSIIVRRVLIKNHITHEGYVKKQRKRVRKLALAIVDGRIGTLEGARELSQLMTEVEFSDSYFSIFKLVDSDTDHLPFGEVRQLWDKEALKRKDEEIKKITKYYEKDILRACKRIIERF